MLQGIIFYKYGDVSKCPFRSAYEKIDTNKIVSISQTVKPNVDTMSFGPPKMGGGVWGRGSCSSVISKEEVL